jgi:hypothetical protein
MPADRITREELMKFLQSISTINKDERESMADTFFTYDRDLQEDFLRNLKLDLKDQKP